MAHLFHDDDNVVVNVHKRVPFHASPNAMSPTPSKRTESARAKVTEKQMFYAH